MERELDEIDLNIIKKSLELQQLVTTKVSDEDIQKTIEWVDREIQFVKSCIRDQENKTYYKLEVQVNNEAKEVIYNSSTKQVTYQGTDLQSCCHWILTPSKTGGVYKLHPKSNPDYELDIFADPVQFKANIEGTTTLEFWDDLSGDNLKALAATNENGDRSTTVYLYPTAGHIKGSSSDTNKYVWTKSVHH